MRQIFIDKFIVPATGKDEFLNRMRISRTFISALPGLKSDAAYERTDEKGNLVCVTIAIWESETALQNAKEAVQAEYKKQGFNPQVMFERLGITMDRGIFKELGE